MRTKVTWMIVSMLLIAGLLTSGFGCAKPAPTPTPAPAPKPAPTLTPAPAPAPKPTATPTPEVKPTVIRMAGFQPVGHPTTRSVDATKEQIEARSKGQIKVDWFPAEMLVKTKEIFPSVARGEIEMGVVAIQYVEGDIPLLQVASLLGVWKSYDHMRAANVAFVNALQGEFNKRGVYLLGAGFCTGYGVWSNKRMATNPADLKGQTISVHSPVFSPLLEAAGATPAFIATPEVYTALQRGTVDGAVFSIATLMNYKLQEVIKYGTNPPLGVPQNGMYANLKWWQGLPQAQRDILQEAATQVFNVKHLQNWLELESTAWGNIKKAINAADLTDAQKVVWLEAGAKADQKIIDKLGPDAQKILDVIRKY